MPVPAPRVGLGLPASSVAPPREPAVAQADGSDPAIWTTAPDTDVCTEYRKAQSPHSSQFGSKQACEQWVQQRRCRPGMSCNNGCNDVRCDATGMHIMSTLMECGLLVVAPLEFREKSVKLRDALDWAEAAARLQRALRLPSRKLKISGFALPSEAASPAMVKRLAQQRAEAVARLLASHGVDRGRFVVEIGDPAELGVEGYRVGRVQLHMEPNRLQPEEYDASYAGYENLCWIKYRTEAAPGTPP